MNSHAFDKSITPPDQNEEMYKEALRKPIIKPHSKKHSINMQKLFESSNLPSSSKKSQKNKHMRIRSNFIPAGISTQETSMIATTKDLSNIDSSLNIAIFT